MTNEHGEKRIRVLLVDDHPSVVQGLRSFMRCRSNITVVGQASDGELAVQRAKHLKPDVILMDLSLPRLDGLQATRQIRSESPDASIIMYTIRESADLAREAIEAGAAGYVLKSSALTLLVRAIEIVHRGGT